MIKNFHKIIILITLIIFGQTARSQIVNGLYGMKKIQTVNNKTIIEYSKKYGIPQNENYVLQKSYTKLLSSFDKIKYKEQIKNHYQPLQALYYDKKGNLKSFQVNCYAGGFPNLDWNRGKIMTTFPPKQQAPIDNIISLDTLMNYLNPLTVTRPIKNENYDYTVIVFWSIFMGRQSKRLIHIVQNNVQLEKNERIRVIYVNTDNFFDSLNKRD